MMALEPAAVISRTKVQQRAQFMQLRSAALAPNPDSKRVQCMQTRSTGVAPNPNTVVPAKDCDSCRRSQQQEHESLVSPAKVCNACGLGQSDLGVSYEALRDKLAAGAWEGADAATRQLCLLAGDEAVKRKWVYFSELQFIPEADLKIVDGLWRAYRGNEFGYSVQRRVWRSANRNWTAFYSKVGWTRMMLTSRNDAYKKFPLDFMWDVADPTPLGHLPLTNALRGTQLLEKLLSHPAFASVHEEEKLLLVDTERLLLQPPSSPRPPQPSQEQQQHQSQPAVIPDDMTVDYCF